MIDSMAPSHPLAGLIWAAVLVIAIQFVPTLAFAHAGHSHQSSGTVTSTHAKAPDVAISEASSPRYLQVVTAASDARPRSSCSAETSGCIGKCCGNGMCCGAAVLKAPEQVTPAAAILTQIVW